MQDLTGAQPDLRISSSQLQASSVEFSLFTMSMGSALLENFGAIVARAFLPARSDTPLESITPWPAPLPSKLPNGEQVQDP